MKFIQTLPTISQVLKITAALALLAGGIGFAQTASATPGDALDQAFHKAMVEHVNAKQAYAEDNNELSTRPNDIRRDPAREKITLDLRRDNSSHSL